MDGICQRDVIFDTSIPSLPASPCSFSCNSLVITAPMERDWGAGEGPRLCLGAEQEGLLLPSGGMPRLLPALEWS